MLDGSDGSVLTSGLNSIILDGIIEFAFSAEIHARVVITDIALLVLDEAQKCSELRREILDVQPVTVAFP